MERHREIKVQRNFIGHLANDVRSQMRRSLNGFEFHACKANRSLMNTIICAVNTISVWPKVQYENRTG
jgi:hypothetical protein